MPSGGRPLSAAAPDDAVAVEVDQPLGMSGMVLRGLRKAPRARQGDLGGVPAAAVPRAVLVRRGVRSDAQALRAFRAVCGLPVEAGCLPPCWPETFFTPLMGQVATSRAFPLSSFGLIHVGQRIEQHHPIDDGAALDLRCSLDDVRETERGVECVFGMAVRVEGALAWSGEALLLSRNARTRRGAGSKGPRPEPPPPPPGRVVIDLAGDVGRRYAAASGDWNPHHLWPWSARLFGYKRPIAHGVWTLARALAELHRDPVLEGPFRAECTFKRPIFMPGRAAIDITPRGDGGHDLAVRDPRSGAPHLLGHVTAGA